MNRTVVPFAIGSGIVAQLIPIAIGSALIASNGLDIIRDNPVANKILVAFLLIVFPILILLGVNLRIETVTIAQIVLYALVISDRNRESTAVAQSDRDKATKIAIAGLALLIVLIVVQLGLVSALMNSYPAKETNYRYYDEE